MPALVRLPRTDFGVEGTEVEKREERWALLLGVFGGSMLMWSPGVVEGVEVIQAALPPPPAVFSPLLLFPVLLLLPLDALARDGEEPNNNDGLPLPNTPVVAEAENLDPLEPPEALLLPLFENPPLAAGKPFPVLSPSMCRANRAASFDRVDVVVDTVVVDAVVAAMAEVVVDVIPETPLLALPILLAPTPAAWSEARN